MPSPYDFVCCGTYVFPVARIAAVYPVSGHDDTDMDYCVDIDATDGAGAYTYYIDVDQYHRLVELLEQSFGLIQ